MLQEPETTGSGRCGREASAPQTLGMIVTRKRKSPAGQARQSASGLTAAPAARGFRLARSIGNSLFPLRVVLFVTLFAWYLWAVVDLRLIFQSREMLFLWNVRYFTDFVGQPGSLMEWAHNLLVQLCYWGWPGAIAVAATVWLLSISTIGLMNALGRARIGGTWVIPVILLVSLYGSSLFPTSTVVGLTLAIGAANLWCRMPACRPWLRLVLFVVVSAVLYYAADKAYYCFAACAAIHEAIAQKRRLSGALFLLAAVAVKFGLDAALVRLNPASHNFYALTLAGQQRVPMDWRETILYWYFPGCALFAVFRQAAFASIGTAWRRLRKSTGEVAPPEPGAGGGSNRKESPCADRAWKGSAIRWAGETALVLSLAGAAGYASFDRDRKLFQEIDYCAEHQRWEDVLAKAERLPLEDHTKYITHDVNLALFHTGRLPYKMFSNPQHSRCPVLITPEQVSPDVHKLYKPFGLLLELGRIGEAERVAIEMFETQPTGTALKRLALTKMIRGQPVDARVVLNVLRDDLIWGRWAKRYLQRLAADANLGDDEEIQRMRELMVAEDDLNLTSHFGSQKVIVDPEVMLFDLLKRNDANRMAFEYLMAIYLCNDNVQGVARLFPYMDGLSSGSTPPFYEEAVLIYLNNHPGEAKMVGSDIYFHGRKISGQTKEKAHRLNEISIRYGGFNEKAEAAMARELGDTYFYYFFYTSRKHT
jgi:hypothetical protein